MELLMGFFFYNRFPSKNKRDYYAILGINKLADLSNIKKAYHQQALLLHPDKNHGLENDNGFKELGQAYSTLSDPEKRTEYDRIYAVDDSIRRDFDPNTTPDDATVKLQIFFELFFEKKGCSIAPTIITVVQRESTVPPEKHVRIFKGVEHLLGIEREEFPYASWHYLQVKIYNKCTETMLCECFQELQEAFASDRVFCDAFTIECRNGEGDELKGIGQMNIDIHLHSVKLLEFAIEKLRNENPAALLDTVIMNKLTENPQDTLAVAAQQILLDVRLALEKEKIATCVAARILYLTRITIQSPTTSNREACTNFITKNDHGTANWWMIISGSFIAFIGIASLKIGIALSRSILPLGISLGVVGVGLIGGGGGFSLSGENHWTRSTIK